MFFNTDKLEKKAKEIENLGEKIIQAQKAVATNRDILSLMFDHIPALIFFKDKENRILNVNQFGVDLWGVPKEKILGHEWLKLTTDELARKYLDNDLDVIESGVAKTNIIEPMSNDPTKMFRTNKIPVFENGCIIGILGFSTEIIEPLSEAENGG